MIVRMILKHEEENCSCEIYDEPQLFVLGLTTGRTYLERIGVKFGENLNAYTSVDETVYNISNVPVTTPGAIDSCYF